MSDEFEDGDEDEFMFQCQLCNLFFPAEPNAVIETIEMGELEELEEWQRENWLDAETGEVLIICPKCMKNMKDYDDL